MNVECIGENKNSTLILKDVYQEIKIKKNIAKLSYKYYINIILLFIIVNKMYKSFGNIQFIVCKKNYLGKSF